MITRWFPWKLILKRAAKSGGFLDPIDLMAKLHSFAQPSEVAEPIELLRAGMIFHARGLINTKAIQHNLDWVWPYWVERQFNPKDPSFIPRSFSITHVNITHRDWTAVGLPDCPALPIIDPRGLVTPFHDGWSLDTWVIDETGETSLFPSKLETVDQQLFLTSNLRVETQASHKQLDLKTLCEVLPYQGGAACYLKSDALSENGGWLVLTLRPYNPEGVSFVHRLNALRAEPSWDINDTGRVVFSEPWDGVQASTYADGDVRLRLQETAKIDCEATDPVGMVTAAAVYKLEPGKRRSITAKIDLDNDPSIDGIASESNTISPWPDAVHGLAELKVPDEKVESLFNAAVRTLILHSPDDMWPGPYTYKRFWFRDAAFIAYAAGAVGLTSRVRRQLDHFPSRQTRGGFFKSQDGEWDSNGEAIWSMLRYLQITNKTAPPEWVDAIIKGADWIMKKRQKCKGVIHDGLLPAGFSAEHLGTNDYYYWDDYWSVAGLQAAAAICDKQSIKNAHQYKEAARELMAAIDKSIEASSAKRDHPGIPASPYRRMDAGAIGSLVCSYPLQVVEPNDQRLMATADFLADNCMCNGGFFQDMIHSGINAYLTLHLAQVYLRAGDPEKAFSMMQTVAGLASPTGQWPEAIHPQTGGGCMGDGEHVWAVAEWVMMVRSLFIREEGNAIILLSGIPEPWMNPGQDLAFGPTTTPFGSITIQLTCSDNEVQVSWSADWHDVSPELLIKLPWQDRAIAIDTASEGMTFERPNSGLSTNVSDNQE